MDKTFVVGDLHARWSSFVNKLELIPEGSNVICVGDIGLGFPRQRKYSGMGDTNFKYYTFGAFVNHVEYILQRNDIQLVCLAGNHDDKSIFKRENHPNITLVANFAELYINGKNFFFIGGAVSLDRSDRKLNIDYWQDEAIAYDEYKKPENQIDVVISHSAPTSCNPVGHNDFCKYWFERDLTLKEESLKERNFLEKVVFEDCKPKKLYYGHFHRSSTELINGCECHCLNELEFKEIIT